MTEDKFACLEKDEYVTYVLVKREGKEICVLSSGLVKDKESLEILARKRLTKLMDK